MKSEVFVDTSGWASLFVATETFHQQAKAWFVKSRQNKQQLATSNYVLTEFVALLNSPLRVSRPHLLKYIEAIKTASYVEIIHIDTTIDAEAWSLLKAREDKNWSLVDGTSFIIMQRFSIQEALTTDHHFEQAGFIRLLKS